MLIPLPEKSDAKTCYYYALNILDERLPKKYEDRIKTNAFYAYRYARDIIKDRFIEAEGVIKTDAYYAYCYAINIIKGRWIEAENVIKTDGYWWNEYKEHFNIC